MHLEALSAPESTALCTLAEVKEQLRLNLFDAAFDPQLDLLRALVAQAFAHRRPPWRLRVRLAAPGSGGRYLRPPAWPVESLVSVRVRGEAIDPEEVQIVSRGRHDDRRELFRAAGWPLTGEDARGGLAHAGTRRPEIELEAWAGWLMPGQVGAWQAETAYGSGIESSALQWVRPSDRTALLRFAVVMAGVSGAVEPAWPVEPGARVVDGSVVWEARSARELPDEVRIAAILQVKEWFHGGLHLPAGVRSEGDGETRVSYSDGELVSALSRSVRWVLERYDLA